MSEKEEQGVVDDRTIQFKADEVELLDKVRQSLGGLQDFIEAHLDPSDEDRIYTQIFSDTVAVNNTQLDESELAEQRQCLDVGLIYDLDPPFEEGGQGVISPAKDKFLNREVAVKTLKKKFLKTPVRKSFIARLVKTEKYAIALRIIKMGSDAML